MAPAFVIGDLHGELAAFHRLLRDAGLTGADGGWAGQDATLWLLGDFYDRGPDGIGCQDLAMRLEREAAAVGGAVRSLLGNHDLLILAARQMRDVPIEPGAETFYQLWADNGGSERDLAQLTPERAAWLCRLPAMALAGDTLLLHADSKLYLNYGPSVQAVNARFAALLTSTDADAWGLATLVFTEHEAFWRNKDVARRTLATFGGVRLVHGHTPIGKMTRQPDRDVTAALVYHGGRCVNCDGGIYRGGAGFVYQLP